MTDWFRNIRLGVIDILGITVPGLLLISFATGGFFLPLTCLVIPFSQGVAGSDLCLNWHRVACLWESNRTPILLLIIILAYILGYILRLVSPNRLDKESARYVIAALSKIHLNTNDTEADHWPIRDVENDKFPYAHFRKYLQDRGHDNLLPLVPWEGKEPWEPWEPKKSSTHIQMMKLEVMSKSPELAALLESKEAHVRLLSGTWSAINSTQRLVYAGIALGCIGLAIAYLWKNDLRMPWPPYVYLSCSIFLFALVAIIEWPKTSKWLEEKIRILPHCGIFRKVLHFIRAPAWIALSVGIIGLGHPYYQPENQVLSQAPYSLSILTAGAIAIGMGWGKTKIERLFHYQRVRELFLIVASVHQVREKDRIAAAEATTHTLRSLP